jgi:molybdopterin-containing oxidoreductase family iron-sulfur binding subunit
VVRGTWRERFGAERFERDWTASLHDGVVAGSALAVRTVALRALELPPRTSAAESPTVELAFAPDPTIGDGRHAHNAWLQELPKPISKLTWSNALMISPGLAAHLDVANEDELEIVLDGSSLRAPVWIQPGQNDAVAGLHLGYGRALGSALGNDAGVNANGLRSARNPWFAAGIVLRKTGARRLLASTQTHATMEGRDIVRVVDRGDVLRARSDAAPSTRASLYPPMRESEYAWAMSIDLDSCIGCGACTIACQAENNIPVVGRDEVRRGREMHWIRVDRYYEGEPAAPRTLFMPVPCMHCEHAPCEVVCPVEASVHDSEGLNVQVYNRCVGTRFCSNNCPYKVRRFNFLQYSRDEPSLNAQRNPEVTVRMRGVMEKCSYCIQRIGAARSVADAQGRRIRDGEVVTACQAACPTQAIVFGDRNDPASAVSARKASPLEYALLGELNTRPRTTYGPRIVEDAGAADSPMPTRG